MNLIVARLGRNVQKDVNCKSPNRNSSHEYCSSNETFDRGRLCDGVDGSNCRLTMQSGFTQPGSGSFLE